MGRGKSKKRRSKNSVPPARDAEAKTPVKKKPITQTDADTAIKKSRFGLVAWLGGCGLVALLFLVLKMIAMNAYAGDEHIYLFQAKLISEGVAPYSGFAMAHPPLHALFTALILKLFGYHFLLGRLLPVLWCLAGGLVLTVVVRREYGAVASISAAALYLLAHEPLRASSHYTGVNMTVALLISAVLAYRLNAIRTTAALSALAVFTRLYAGPGVLILVVFALLADRRKGIRLVAWGAGIGVAGFVVFGLWTGFGDMVHNMFLYHAQKTPMKPGALTGMRDKVLFHNAVIAILFVLSQIALLATITRAYTKTDTSLGPIARVFCAVRSSRVGLIVLSGLIAFFFLAVLLNMNRVWMYYFIPSFPFAAIAGGWLISKWIDGAILLVRTKAKPIFAESGRRISLVGGTFLFIAFVLACYLSPMLEWNLGYYKREMKKSPMERVHAYNWNPGLLPGSISELVRSTLWKEKRVIGEKHTRFNYYLWHESRILNVVDEVVATIKAETTSNGGIFGDSGTVPLFALLSGHPIAGNEVDTNIQRYRSGNANPKDLIKKIDRPSTEMIILRHRFGVAGVKEVQLLIKKKYKRIKSVRTAQGRVFHLFKRRADEKRG
ncbi:MAG: glycosyltransferase family 39 protein [Proteobacteria bacterium]|nr:glycosyltransferase family 39 protein [Pseudomonadota bacterium]